MPFAGAVTRQRSFNRAIGGELTFSGAIGEGKSLKRAIGGILSFSGDVASLASRKLVEGVISFSGVVTRIKNGIPVGVGNIFSNSKRFFRRHILQWR